MHLPVVSQSHSEVSSLPLHKWRFVAELQRSKRTANLSSDHHNGACQISPKAGEATAWIYGGGGGGEARFTRTRGFSYSPLCVGGWLGL